MSLARARMLSYLEDIQVEIELVFAAIESTGDRPVYYDSDLVQYNGRETTTGELWKLLHQLWAKEDTYKLMLSEIELNLP